MNRFSRKLSLLIFDKKVPLGINKPVKHILVINWHGRIGDAIVSSFFFREIRKIDNIIISIVTTESLKSLYIDYYKVDNVYTVSNKFINHDPQLYHDLKGHILCITFYIDFYLFI